MKVIGIDPGVGGAVAVIVESLEVEVYDTPVLTVRKGKKGGIRHEFDENAMAYLLQKLTYSFDCVAAIEKVHSMPDQGAASGFSFGEGFGIWRGILAALNIPRDYITPQRWKKVMLDGMGKDKDASRLRAKQLFPSVDLSLVKHHGRADALLIAEYRRRIEKGAR